MVDTPKTSGNGVATQLESDNSAAIRYGETMAKEIIERHSGVLAAILALRFQYKTYHDIADDPQVARLLAGIGVKTSNGRHSIISKVIPMTLSDAVHSQILHTVLGNRPSNLTPEHQRKGVDATRLIAWTEEHNDALVEVVQTKVKQNGKIPLDSWEDTATTLNERFGVELTATQWYNRFRSQKLRERLR